MIAVHERFSGGSTPSCGSTARPRKSIGSPTAQSRLGEGSRISTSGGVLSAVTVTAATSLAPAESVTRRRTRWLPGAAKLWLGAGSAESSKAPSSSRSHANARLAPSSGSLLARPSSATRSGAAPLVGVAWITAVGGVLAAKYSTRKIWPPSKST
jgi:hypothetical protein